jgi:RimJ/RimL family protein N-acetyltransferase
MLFSVPTAPTVTEYHHPKAEQPVGPSVEDRPAMRPGPVTLTGRFGHVEKLKPEHASALWQAVKGHDQIWTYIPTYGPFPDAAAFSAWVFQRATLDDPYSYAIVDAAGRAVGVFTLMAIRPENRVIEVGHVVYSPALQRTPLATEAQYLLARYAFETLGYRRYEWKCDSLNAASRRAALRYGFTLEGIFRQHMIGKGRSRDTAWYAMLDGEWPARKANFERWLAPDNFAADGRQIQSLSAMNSGTA